jgi:hypothetical protein
MFETICQQYMDLIRKLPNYKPGNLSKVTDFNFETMIRLSRYYDELSSHNDECFDNRFFLRLKDKYGADTEYWQEITK